MTADDYVGIVTLVQRELWNKGRIELVDEYYAKGCMIHGTGEEIVVADAIKNAMIQLRTSFPDWHEKLEDIFASGNKVRFRHTSTGTHREAFLGYPASGNRVRVKEIGIVLFKERKIVEHWAMYDLFGWLTQVGVRVGR